MKIKRTVYNSYICKAVIKRLRSTFKNMNFRFDKQGFPLQYVFCINDYATNFNFTNETVKELSKISIHGDPYDFVIDTLYYSCLAEIAKLDL